MIAYAALKEISMVIPNHNGLPDNRTLDLDGNAAMVNAQPLVGKWFHSFRDDEVSYQGQFVDHIQGEFYIVRLHSWVDGESTGMYLVQLNSLTMEPLKLFDTAAEMRESYEECMNEDL